ncbi:molecular chaperone TorD family protein [Anaerobacillus sp. HL2]|nr:molecular chaperone TorD family protein [Anaerobacillus sp. HL2]
MYRFRKDVTKLKVDFAKLFVGPFDVLAPPYSSVYLNEGRAVYGESTPRCSKYV